MKLRVWITLKSTSFSKRETIALYFCSSCSNELQDYENVAVPPVLTFQFMTGKHLQKGYNTAIFNLTRNNLGPFNHTNIIQGTLRVGYEFLKFSLFRNISKELGDGKFDTRLSRLYLMRLCLKRTVMFGT